VLLYGIVLHTKTQSPFTCVELDNTSMLLLPRAVLNLGIVTQNK
jgi:hypothetical protein